METFWVLADRHGFAFVSLAAVIIAGWRFFVVHLWPGILRQNEAAYVRLDKVTDAFLQALESQRKMEHASFKELAEVIAIRFDRIDAKLDDLRWDKHREV